jgi:hypothetical protein
MTDDQANPSERIRRKRGLTTRAVRVIIFLLVAYFSLAYVAVPYLWRLAARHHPALDGIPTIAHTKDGIPGDPLNIAFIGSEEQISKAMEAADWHPADPITLKSSLRIIGDTVRHRPYDDAPVSNLYVWNRKQDLAFEQPVGNDPRSRHHVRFWKSDQLDMQGRPLWIGAATLDICVGFSHTTGEVTHHIGPNVDAERDKIVADLERIKAITDVDFIADFQPHLEGKNGGGDKYKTDGSLALGVLTN